MAPLSLSFFLSLLCCLFAHYLCATDFVRRGAQIRLAFSLSLFLVFLTLQVRTVHEPVAHSGAHPSWSIVCLSFLLSLSLFSSISGRVLIITPRSLFSVYVRQLSIGNVLVGRSVCVCALLVCPRRCCRFVLLLLLLLPSVARILRSTNECIITDCCCCCLSVCFVTVCSGSR